MDVRCEKCQTEYELDEARLKPGGVTVKCTNCGHMFKIRRRTITNVGAPPVPREPTALATSRARPVSPRPAPPPAPVSLPAPGTTPRPDSIFDDDARQSGADEAPTTVDRQWLLRLENGEQKSCRELATLQQWIIAGVITRESLISRTGKTWKRLGDIAELGQYFTIADEARANRDRMKPVSRPAVIPTTLPGYSAAQAAGGTILPDDDEIEAPTTRANKNRVAGTAPPPVPRGAVRTPPMGQPQVVSGASATEPAAIPPPPPQRRPATTPPPLPTKRVAPRPPTPPPIPQGNRATAMWATDGVKPEAPPATGPAGPVAGKLAAIPDEPAFAGRVRMSPSDDSTFSTDKVRALDDDDLIHVRRGTRTGTLVLVIALLVMGAAAAVVYVFALRKTPDDKAALPRDAAVIATATDAAGPPDSAPVDAVAVDPLDTLQGELAADIEGRLRTAAQSLDGKGDPPSQAMRAHVIARLAQDLLDRASVTADKIAAEELRKEAKQLVLDAATAAQRALMAAGDDAGANIAMAEVLRLQGKPARDVKRYLDTARAKADKRWARDLALADALVLVRDGKLDDARAALTAIDQGDDKLETSGDVRARFHLALVLSAQGKAADARPLIGAIVAAQPEHAAARALASKLETLVAKTDPLPPEDGARDAGKDAGTAQNPGTRANPVGPGPVGPGPGPATGGGDSYDRLLARANALAETSCAKAMELYSKALEQKPNGVEALTGLGYCHIDSKQFSSAFSNFRAALAVSPRYEAALRGIAETYQQQGRKEQAIEAYKAYLDAYPNSAAARRQLERLGGDTAPAPPPSNEPGPAAPPPAPPPPPAPTPAEPSGQGSGSG